MDQKITRAPSLRGTVSVPGDKSISHRSLMIGALGGGVSEVRGFLNAADPRSTFECLRLLGVEFESNGDTLRIYGKGIRGLQPPRGRLDAGNSGTTMRLLTGILAGQPFETEISGDESLNKRPMKRILTPLSRMGGVIEATAEFTAPLRISGKYPLRPIDYEMPISSAQVKSAILLAGLFAEGTTRVIEKVATRDHTERMLDLRVLNTEVGHVSEVEGGMRIPPQQFVVPGDISSAAFIIAAGLIVPHSDIILKNIGLNPTRTRILDIVKSVGGNVEIIDQHIAGGEPIGDIRVRNSELRGDIKLIGTTVAELIDEIPILAIISLFTDGSFVLKDASDLRHKESDRIKSMVVNLRKIGTDVEEYEDGFAFEGKNALIAAEIDSFFDHRIAMAFGVVGLTLQGETIIRNSDCVDISFPGFWEVIGMLQH